MRDQKSPKLPLDLRVLILHIHVHVQVDCIMTCIIIIVYYYYCVLLLLCIIIIVYYYCVLGFRLGDREGPSEYVPGIRVSVGKEKVTKKLVFWRNGFSVDDGPLRTGQTPQDRIFLESISKG